MYMFIVHTRDILSFNYCTCTLYILSTYSVVIICTCTLYILTTYSVLIICTLYILSTYSVLIICTCTLYIRSTYSVLIICTCTLYILSTYSDVVVCTYSGAVQRFAPRFSGYNQEDSQVRKQFKFVVSFFLFQSLKQHFVSFN